MELNSSLALRLITKLESWILKFGILGLWVEAANLFSVLKIGNVVVSLSFETVK